MKNFLYVYLIYFRGVVSDNQVSNVAAYKKLLNEYGEDGEALSVMIDRRKVYLAVPTVHLLKKHSQ